MCDLIRTGVIELIEVGVREGAIQFLLDTREFVEMTEDIEGGAYVVVFNAFGEVPLADELDDFVDADLALLAVVENAGDGGLAAGAVDDLGGGELLGICGVWWWGYGGDGGREGDEAEDELHVVRSM